MSYGEYSDVVIWKVLSSSTLAGLQKVSRSGAHTTSLCGRNAVQVAHRSATRLNFEDLARHLGALGEVSYNRFLLRFTADGHEFTVFPDGRAIIKGTSDVDKARTLYAKYIGH